jgi:hypothetical protein
VPLVFAEEASSFFHAIGALFWGHCIYLDGIYVHGIIMSLVLPLLVSFFEVSFLFAALLEALSENCVKVQPGILLLPCSSDPLIQGFRSRVDLFPDGFMQFLVKSLSE